MSISQFLATFSYSTLCEFASNWNADVLTRLPFELKLKYHRLTVANVAPGALLGMLE